MNTQLFTPQAIAIVRGCGDCYPSHCAGGASALPLDSRSSLRRRQPRRKIGRRHRHAQPAAQPAQPSAAPADDRARRRFKVPVNEVSLIFTVTDKHGHYIANLNQSDFALLDDQKAPEKVNSFHQQINLPLRVGIVIDASSSIRSRFQFEQQSATEFLLASAQGEERPRLCHGIRRDADA